MDSKLARAQLIVMEFLPPEKEIRNDCKGKTSNDCCIFNEKKKKAKYVLFCFIRVIRSHKWCSHISNVEVIFPFAEVDVFVTLF
jgi:hypothetical protein